MTNDRADKINKLCELFAVFLVRAVPTLDDDNVAVGVLVVNRDGNGRMYTLRADLLRSQKACAEFAQVASQRAIGAAA
jgi:hypothetical protein